MQNRPPIWLFFFLVITSRYAALVLQFVAITDTTMSGQIICFLGAPPDTSLALGTYGQSGPAAAVGCDGCASLCLVLLPLSSNKKNRPSLLFTISLLFSAFGLKAVSSVLVVSLPAIPTKDTFKAVGKRLCYLIGERAVDSEEVLTAIGTVPAPFAILSR